MRKRSSVPPLTTVARYRLYERAVLSPAFEVAFFDRVFGDAFAGATPFRLREDFCGTGAIARTFAAQSDQHLALGVDLDADVLAFAAAEGAPTSGLQWSAQDVRSTNHARDRAFFGPTGPDVISAQNFSWCGLHTRSELLRYFSACHAALGAQGVLVLDCLGGSDRERGGDHDRRDVGACVVTFRQATFDVVTRRAEFHLDFTLEGHTHHSAFTYDWRLWTIPETRDILLDAGFDDVIVYWEARDAFGAATSHYAPTTSEPGCKRFVAYLVAIKATEDTACCKS